VSIFFPTNQIQIPPKIEIFMCGEKTDYVSWTTPTGTFKVKREGDGKL